MVCTKEGFWQHNDEVDSSVEVYELIRRFDDSFSALVCAYGGKNDNPTWKIDVFGQCWFSHPNRGLDTFNCGDPDFPSYRRLCFCHEPISAIGTHQIEITS